MNNFNNKIDRMVSKILNEEIEKKVKKFTKEINEGEWKEIEVDEALHGKQKKLDVAEPKGKLTAADFKKLRAKKETKEQVYFEDEFINDEDEAEKLSQQEPTYVGRGLQDNKIGANIKNKIFGSFEEQGDWYDEEDSDYKGQFDFDYDEEEFDDFEPFFEKFGEKTRWFQGGDEGKKMFNMYKDRFGPMIVRVSKGLEEGAETEEGNAFSGARQEAIDAGKTSFDFEGERYPVTGSKKLAKEEKEEKWIQKTKMKKGGLHKKLNVPEGDKIPQSKLKSLKKELMKKGEGDKKLSAADSKLLKQVNLALTLKNIKESRNTITLTENELVDMIEKIVVEQKVKDKAEKSNISKKEPEGLKKTIKAQSASKKENEDYAKSVVKKMKDYVKAGSVGEFKEDSKTFPESNYSLGKMKEKTKKYHPSAAVDEYIENFAYPGMENLKYDEIKPNEEWVTANIVGSSKTGNNPEWANAVKTEFGEKMNKKRIKNAYQQEKMRSYNRVTQPVDETGEAKGDASLDKVFKQLESVKTTNNNKLNEDVSKMKSLIKYDRKTQ